MIRQVRSLNVDDTLAIADQIPNLDVPARLVWGAADRFQKIGYGYRLAYELGASIERIEGAKHFVPEDYPEQVAAYHLDTVWQACGVVVAGHNARTHVGARTSQPGYDLLTDLTRSTGNQNSTLLCHERSLRCCVRSSPAFLTDQPLLPRHSRSSISSMRRSASAFSTNS
jgi:hypothetical protein